MLADCYRAQGRFADVEALWSELSAVSPSGALVNEGRIVMAGAIADRGDVDAAVRMLAKGWKRPSRPKEHHLRRAYALADLYERSGDVPRARALFDWIVAKDPDFVDSASSPPLAPVAVAAGRSGHAVAGEPAGGAEPDRRGCHRALGTVGGHFPCMHHRAGV